VVVGVADDVRADVASEDFTRSLYLPMLPEGLEGPPPSRMTYVLATSVPPSTLVPAVRAALGQIDPLVPVAQVRTLQEVIGEATAPTAFALVLIGLAAAIATLLGTVGVYAVVAYVVGGRTREIGVRMAMGARAGDVQRMVLRQGGTVILIGIAVGLAAAYLLTGLMSGLLYGVSPTDPVSYVAVTTLMLAVAGLALWIPSRRAARVDPLEALRSE
jgi:putative ABC transport system permease protein